MHKRYSVARSLCVCIYYYIIIILYGTHIRMGVPSVSKILTNAILVYLPLIYKYDTDLAKYLPDLYIYIWDGLIYIISDIDIIIIIL